LVIAFLIRLFPLLKPLVNLLKSGWLGRLLREKQQLSQLAILLLKLGEKHLGLVLTMGLLLDCQLDYLVKRTAFLVHR